MSLIPFVILDVDARDKRGHDESNIARIGITHLVFGLRATLDEA